MARFDGFVNADFYRLVDLVTRRSSLPDWMLDISKPWKCENNYWEGIFTEHTLEHLDYNQVIKCLKECFRTLVPGGTIRIVLPGCEPALKNSITYKYKALAIGFLTQTHGHLSVWDSDLQKSY